MSAFKLLDKMTVSQWVSVLSIIADSRATRKIALDEAMQRDASEDHIQWLRDRLDEANRVGEMANYFVPHLKD